MAELATNVRYIKGSLRTASRVLARLGINTLRTWELFSQRL